MVVRDRTYSELKDSLIGKKVIIWTCGTCVKLCYEIGGNESAQRLASALKNDGVDVIAVLETNAACLEGKVRTKYDPELMKKADVILSLTCNIGALCAKRVFGMQILNPVATLGAGFADEKRRKYVCEEKDGELTIKALDELAEEKGFRCDPYI